MSEPQDTRLHAPSTETAEIVGDHARLALKPGMPRTGFVDGGWWPRSRDLRRELPDLITSLSAQVGPGPVERVAFDRSRWSPAGRQRLVTGTGRVALDGFSSFEPNTVWVGTRSTAGVPLCLVVIPPETPHSHAVAALRRASTADNVDRPAELIRWGDQTALDDAAAPSAAVPAVRGPGGQRVRTGNPDGAPMVLAGTTTS